MGCLKLTYYPETELKTVNAKKELTTKISSKRLRSSYLFGFNGKENDNEVKGEGNSLDFGARIYDSRLGRWLSVDPLADDAPGWTPYRYCFNNPIKLIDPDGRSEGSPDEWNFNVETGETKWVSNKGGAETQYVNFTDNKGSKLANVAVPGLESKSVSSFGLLLSGVSLSAESVKSIGQYASKISLLSQGKFAGSYKGVSTAWSLNFLGNKTVPSSLVTAQKATFLKNMSYLKFAKYLGTGTSALSAMISFTQMTTTNKPELAAEYTFDFGMSLVGFYGLAGSATSLLYTLDKPLMKKWNTYVLQPNMDLNPGGPIILAPLAPFK